MSCQIIKDGAVTVIACSRGAPYKKPCKYCGRKADHLCDYPVTREGVKGTCDIPCCSEHIFPHFGIGEACLQHHNFIEKNK